MDAQAYVDPSVAVDDDDGTMPQSIATLAEAVVGHRIVFSEQTNPGSYNGSLILTLDNGTRVIVDNDDDCCAYTELQAFLFNPELADHVITGVRTEDGYTNWHIFADLGDVLQLTVDWSCGNPFYYGYGFDIKVEPAS